MFLPRLSSSVGSPGPVCMCTTVTWNPIHFFIALSSGSSIAVSLLFCSSGSLSPGEISLVLPCQRIAASLGGI